MDDFEQDLIDYSEMEITPKDQFEVALPKTIQQYLERIQSNNSTSIFDADYSLDGPTSDSALGTDKEVNDNFDDDLGVFKDEKVTYIISGRGRGGRNILVNPGELSRNKVLNGDDEIRQLIRKVAPIGYSNEITESTVRAHKMAKVMEVMEVQVNKSPIISKPSSPADCKTNLKANSISPTSSKTKSSLSIESPVSSRNSTSASDVPSSVYFTSQDQNISSSPKSNHKEEESDKSEDESSEALTASEKIEPEIQINTGAVPKKPVPLSVMLKQSREAHKKKQLHRNNGFSSDFSKENENELASQRKIQEILRQDLLEQEMRRKQLSEQSSSSSVSSRDDVLPWRRRNNSPPRYSWGEKGDWRREPKSLNIHSVEDFPALK